MARYVMTALLSSRFYAERAFGASYLVTLVAGGLAQCATVLVVYPVRSGKDKLQGQKQGQYRGLLDVWRVAYQQDGIRGIYSGMGVDLVSAFIKKGLTFWSRDLFVVAYMAFARRRLL